MHGELENARLQVVLQTHPAGERGHHRVAGIREQRPYLVSERSQRGRGVLAQGLALGHSALRDPLMDVGRSVRQRGHEVLRRGLAGHLLGRLGQVVAHRGHRAAGVPHQRAHVPHTERGPVPVVGSDLVGQHQKCVNRSEVQRSVVHHRRLISVLAGDGYGRSASSRRPTCGAQSRDATRHKGRSTIAPQPARPGRPPRRRARGGLWARCLRSHTNPVARMPGSPAS